MGMSTHFLVDSRAPIKTMLRQEHGPRCVLRPENEIPVV
jgi:hypothetical protein